MSRKFEGRNWLKVVGVFSFLTVSIVPFSAQAQECGDSWTNVYYYGGLSVRAMASNGSRYVAVGDCDADDCSGGGLILTSTDTVNWTRINAGLLTRWGIHGVTYGGGAFVAVGNKGRIMRSTNGTSWTGIWPADPYADSDSDGTIDLIDEDAGICGVLVSVQHDGSKFITVGQDNNGLDSKLFTSPDGLTWTERACGGYALQDVCYAPEQPVNKYIAVGTMGTILRSSNGTSWTLVYSTFPDMPANSHFYSVDYGNGVFITVGKYSKYAISSDGQNWGALQELTGVGAMNEIRYAGSLFVLATADPLASNESVWTTAYGNSWEEHPTTGPLRDDGQAYGKHHYGAFYDEVGDKAFVMGSGGTIRYSDCPPIPYMVEHPANETVCETTSAQFCVDAVGEAPLSYQWQRNSGGWSDIGGAQTECYLIGSASTSDAGEYRCRVWNNTGTITSDAALLTVRVPPKTFSQQPVSDTRCEFELVALCVTTDGSTPLYYQWERNIGSGWENAPNGYPSCLTMNSVDPVDEGAYRCQVWNDCGTITSNETTLTVTARAKPDFDCDDDVDQDDFGHFQACLTGPGEPQTDPACVDAKLDGDTDVDGDDFAKFLTCMSTSGPGIPATLDCAD